MSTVYLVPDDTSFDAIGFDSTDNETHASIVQLTDNPIEDGSSVTDHIIISPKEFSCGVRVSQKPIETTWFGDGSLQTVDISVSYFEGRRPLLGGVFQAAGNLLDPPAPPPKTIQAFTVSRQANRIAEMYDRLISLQLAAATLTILTSARAYETMILTEVNLPRGPLSIGTGAFTLKFRQLRIVQTRAVTAPKPKEPRGEKSQAKGPAGSDNLSDSIGGAVDKITAALDKLAGDGSESAALRAKNFIVGKS